MRGREGEWEKEGGEGNEREKKEEVRECLSVLLISFSLQMSTG